MIMSREFPIPGFSNYTATLEGNIISYKGKRARMLKQKPQKNARSRKQVSLVDDEGNKKYLIAHRVIASAKLGRPLEDWEQVRHLGNDRNDNHMKNLTVGCAVLNMLDDIEAGTRFTSPEYLEEALVRIVNLLKSHEK